MGAVERAEEVAGTWPWKESRGVWVAGALWGQFPFLHSIGKGPKVPRAEVTYLPRETQTASSKREPWAQGSRFWVHFCFSYSFNNNNNNKITISWMACCTASYRDRMRTPQGNTRKSSSPLLSDVDLLPCYLGRCMCSEAPATHLFCGGCLGLYACELYPFPHCDGYKTSASSEFPNRCMRYVVPEISESLHHCLNSAKSFTSNIPLHWKPHRQFAAFYQLGGAECCADTSF